LKELKDFYVWYERHATRGLRFNIVLKDNKF